MDYAAECLNLFTLVLPLALCEWLLLAWVVWVCERLNWEERK